MLCFPFGFTTTILRFSTPLPSLLVRAELGRQRRRIQQGGGLLKSRLPEILDFFSSAWLAGAFPSSSSSSLSVNKGNDVVEEEEQVEGKMSSMDSVPSIAAHGNLDEQIAQLMQCKPLSEQEVTPASIFVETIDV